MLRAPRLAWLLPGLRSMVPWRGFPVSVISGDLSDEGIDRALREGPYGLCAYRAGGGQPDHQETIIEFEGGLTATLSMHGHSYKEGRTLRVDGTRGSLLGAFGGGGGIELRDHKTGRRRRLPVRDDLVGHAGADSALMDSYVANLAAAAGGKGSTAGGKGSGPSLPMPTTAAESLASHRMAWAADLSRREGRVVELD